MRSLYFILLLSATLAVVFSDCSNLEKYFFIRNQVSGLVLDSTGYDGIKLQVFNQSSTGQRFDLKPASRPGLFNINTVTSSMFPHSLAYVPPGDVWNNSNLISDYTSSSIHQQWFFDANGLIINGGLQNYGITVDASYTTGTYVYVGPILGLSPNQVFELTDEIPIE